MPGLRPSSTLLLSSESRAEATRHHLKQLKASRPGLCWRRWGGSLGLAQLGWVAERKECRCNQGPRLTGTQRGDSIQRLGKMEGSVPAPGVCLRWGFKISAQSGPWLGGGERPPEGARPAQRSAGEPRAGTSSAPLMSCHDQYIFVSGLSKTQIIPSCLKIKKEKL